MKLIHVSIEGFRRFENRCTIRFEGPLTAIVGPNEAGKSSILRALRLLNDDEAIPDTDSTRQAAAHLEITATFTVDKTDRDYLGDLPGAEKVRKLTIRKRADGQIIGTAEPAPPHDMSVREAVHSALVREGSRESRVLANAEGNNKVKVTFEELDKIAVLLSTDQVDIVSAVPRLRGVAAAIDKACQMFAQFEDELERLASLADSLRDLAEHEADPAPIAIGRLLAEIRPKFLFFDDEARILDTVHPLSAPDDDRKVALRNLVDLAELNLPAVEDAVAKDRPGDRDSELREANDRLHEVFSKAWVRPQVTPVFAVNGTDELHVVVRDFNGKTMSPVSERSDGLRWFIAMRAFVGANANRRNKPILLVDEAETHLSYDAQANLVAELTEQQVAQKVIYTTHSAGCLPSDLGTGIKPVVASDDQDRSTISNNFWQQDQSRPGFTSLMLAMGASALAFTPARSVVIGEGPSECILLPTLLRQATRKTLGFQVAPGLSEVSEVTLPYLLDSAARVAFVVDADEGGRKRRTWATRKGIPERQFVMYNDTDVALDVVAIEDLVDADVYRTAVNAILDQYSLTDERLEPSDVPAKDRANVLKKWLEDRDLDGRSVQKPVVCQEVVNMSYELDGSKSMVVAKEHVEGLKRLHRELVKRLNPLARWPK